MLRPIAIAISLVASATSAIGQAREAFACVETAKTGFAFKNGRYGPAHFFEEKFTLVRNGSRTGAFRSDEGNAEPEATQREDGSWLLAGWMPADEMADQLGVVLPQSRDYETVAGLIIGELQHLPATGETVETLGWWFEVVDMDGRRIDKVLARRVEHQDAENT